MNLYDFQFIYKLLESIDCKANLTDEEEIKITEFFNILDNIVKRELRDRKLKNLEDDLIQINALFDANKKTEALDLLKKLTGD